MDAEIFLFILNEPALVFLSELTQTYNHATNAKPFFSDFAIALLPRFI